MEKIKRIRIITGHYGSGKSEFTVNYALQLRKKKVRFQFLTLMLLTYTLGLGEKGVP